MHAMSRYPERIVCLTEETIETLYLLGEGQRVVGISGYTMRPPEARQKLKSTYRLAFGYRPLAPRKSSAPHASSRPESGGGPTRGSRPRRPPPFFSAAAKPRT